ncbi:Endo-1,4-beta-xylanase A [Streptomyces sp. RB5]|uniref:Beta-xylanase n=1 Tax=Streptomyces smaragdinus TaxID=2585196 RepID=A0A7K0CC79_9ACTN|nr:endo-1,4-beta-xylanase [Streptomyces smaragdinus]MQY10712.1 Endo-1,4-beta-xylanase A [Streptomyces smaragdinus]
MTPRPLGPATAAALAAMLLLGTASTVSAQPAHDRGDTPLRALADRQDLRIGTAVDMNALADDEQYRTIAAREFSSVTAENVMKWEAVEPQQGVNDFTQADALVDFAHRNKQAVRGHTLVWHNQLPAWLTAGVADGSIDATELRRILHDHITTTVKHFKGKIYQWDVVNEIFDDNAQLRDSIWLQQLGPSYIADAFRWAHAADPGAKLFLNDYNTEGVNAKSTAYYELAKELRAQGVPVQGMGIQGHLDIQYGFPGDVQDNLERFSALGMQTAFTEVDVRMDLPADDAKLTRQADDYRRLVQACLNVRRCTSFTVWGYTDKYSWIPGVFTGQGAANLFDEVFAVKPAYTTVRDTLAAREH